MRRRAQHQLWWLLAPYLLGLVGLVLLPALLVAPFAFTDYQGFGALHWTGLDNFRRFAADRVFGPSLKASLGLALLVAPARGLIALGLALLVRTPFRGRAVLQRTVFIPTVIPDVVYALLWLYIFNPLWGPLNWLLPIAGFPTDGWLRLPGPAKLAVAISLCWTVGEGIVLLLAARRELSSELYEAAALDGAGPVAMFRAITLPLLLPFLTLLLCRDVIVSINASFIAALVMTQGGPYYATAYLPYWIYQNTTKFSQVGYAAALNLLLFALTLAVLALLLRLSRRWWQAADL